MDTPQHEKDDHDPRPQAATGQPPADDRGDAAHASWSPWIDGAAVTVEGGPESDAPDALPVDPTTTDHMLSLYLGFCS